MPELPEVQTTVDGINNYVKNLQIIDVWTDYWTKNNTQPTTHNWTNQIKNPVFFKKFKKEVIGSKILKAERRAKNILIDISNGKTILIHMKMTGHILYGAYRKLITNNLKLKTESWVPTQDGPLKDPFNRFIHLVFSLSNGKHLALSDMRKFAKVSLLETKDISTYKDLKNLGPEPLKDTFTAEALSERLKLKPKGKIKTVLMDQSIVSGIGNIYSDEILWSSNIHPLSIVSHLKKKDIENIWKYAKVILKKGIDFGGDSMSDYRNLDGERGRFQNEHNAYKRKGEKCKKKNCFGTIHREMIGGRSAHFCPTHQILLS